MTKEKSSNKGKQQQYSHKHIAKFKKLFCKGFAVTRICKKLGVPKGTADKWIHTNNWQPDKKLVKTRMLQQVTLDLVDMYSNTLDTIDKGIVRAVEAACSMEYKDAGQAATVARTLVQLREKLLGNQAHKASKADARVFDVSFRALAETKDCSAPPRGCETSEGVGGEGEGEREN